MYGVSKTHRRTASNPVVYSTVNQQKIKDYMEYYNKFSQILYKQNQYIHHIQRSHQYSNQINVEDIFQHPAGCPKTPFSLKATVDEDNAIYTDRDETNSTATSDNTESTTESNIDESMYADEDLCLDEDEKDDSYTSSRKETSSDDVPISPIEQILTQNLQIEQNSHFASQACKKARRNMYHQRGKSVSFIENHGFYDNESPDDESDDGMESNYVLTTILESSMGSKKKTNSTISKSRLYNSTPRNMAAGTSLKKHLRDNLDSYRHKKTAFQVDKSRYQDLFACNLSFLQAKRTQTAQYSEIVNV